MKKFWEGVLAFGPLICLVISISYPIYWCIYERKEKKLEDIHKIPY